MRVGGVILIIFGAFWMIAGFLSYASDIQLGLALSGICMMGIGGALIALANIREVLMDIRISILKRDE